MSNVKTLVLKNYLLLPLVTFLSRLELKSKMSRARSHVIKIMADRIEQNELVRVEMVSKHAEKNEKGEPILENGVYKMGDEMKTFEDEYLQFIKEDVIFDILPSNEQDIKTIVGILENTEEKFSATSMPNFQQYEEICEAFNLIK